MPIESVTHQRAMDRADSRIDDISYTFPAREQPRLIGAARRALNPFSTIFEVRRKLFDRNSLTSRKFVLETEAPLGTREHHHMVETCVPSKEFGPETKPIPTAAHSAGNQD